MLAAGEASAPCSATFKGVPMRKMIHLLLMVIAGSYTAVLQAQAYPTKPIRVIVGIAPGGGLDGRARLIANKLAEVLAQQVVVENRPGGGGNIAAAMVAKAAPDGYTLLHSESSLSFAPSVYKDLPFDPVKNFTPIGSLGKGPLVIAVHPSMPANNASELIALFKANPGKFSYGSPGVGTLHHLAVELFLSRIGAKVVHVPYKGATQLMPDLITGVLNMAIVSLTAAVPQAKAGKLKPIALTSPAKLAIAPDWPALADTLPGFDASPTQFIFGPAGITGDVVSRLSEGIRAVLAADDVKKGLLAQGATADFVPAEALATLFAAESKLWNAVAKEAGIKPE
jgi:tripartite-type tricarboxylate transporter receptor subunit TctC